MKAFEKHINIVFLTLFFISISVPGVITLVQKKSGISRLEKRKLTPFPHFQKDSIAEFFDKFEQYYNDNFVLRLPLSKTYARFKYYALSESAKPSKVIVGKNDFFYLGNSFSNVVKESFGQAMFSENFLKKRKNELLKRKRYLESRGILFFIVIAPNKHSLYKEYFPYHKYAAAKNRKDQWVTYMTQAGLGENIIDLSGYLQLKKSKDTLLYRKLDSHWNELGAYYAYANIMDRINLHINVPKMSLSSYRINTLKTEGGNAKMLGLSLTENTFHLTPLFDTRQIKQLNESFYHNDKIWEHRYYNPHQKYTILFFRDSFTTALIPFFTHSFQKLSCVWHQAYDPLLIESEKPDVVIIETVERYLENI